MSIPGYDQLHEVARHGLGSIYRARELASGRLVSLEVYRGWSNQQLRIPQLERLRARAEAVATLDHPNILPVLRVGECEQGLFLVRPWHDGRGLDEECRSRRPTPAEAVEWVRELALAAHHAHEHGIYHCDIKPGNVWLRDDPDGPRVPLLTGFDSAFICFLPPQVSERDFDAIVGTPRYMAPERVMGRQDEVGAATDVWGLGVVLFQLLAARSPFQGETVMDILQAVLACEPARLIDVGLDIDDNLDRICMKCLAKKPEQRYASGAELADDLARYVPGERPAPPPPLSGRLGGWVRGLLGRGRVSRPDV